MRAARWIFAIAAIWGIAIVAPLYFLEAWIGANMPPAIARPELFYGFVGAVLVYQLLYALIATDPIRYRPVMLIGVLAKLSFFIACLMLFIQGRISDQVMASVVPDLILACLFVFAWTRTPAIDPGAKEPSP